MKIQEIQSGIAKLGVSAKISEIQSYLQEIGISEKDVQDKDLEMIADDLKQKALAIAAPQKTSQPSQLAIAAPTPAVNRKTKAATSFETAKDRKVDAATDVATGGDRFVADVLEEAERKANEKLQAQKQALVSELSDAMVEHRLSQARTSVDFFMNQWGSTDALLNPYRQAMAEDDQTETIEVSAS